MAITKIACYAICMKQQVIPTEIPEPAISRFLFADTRTAWIWLPLRIYVGWEWLEAGYGKVMSPAWVGPKAGIAVEGFLKGALEKTSGAHPDVPGWYAMFIKEVALPNADLFSYAVAYGEVLVGIALILGLFTGIAAFFGGFMNMNYLFAGTVSSNPILFLIQLLLILSWRVAGWIGLDRYILPKLGTPWKPGQLFKK
jgi:thiosulfate dehydrogenase [quinone] large subunit